MAQLSNEIYKKFCDLIYAKSGIFLSEKKKELLQARIGKILRKRNIPDYESYYKIINNDNSGRELIDLLNAVSTNLTYFFREENHFIFLEYLIKQGYFNDRSTSRIWSSACSTGEEPYSIAITISQNLSYDRIKSIKILATDIATDVLQRGIQGIYPNNSLDKLPKSIAGKYFTKSNEEGFIRVNDQIKSMILFKRLNLISSFPFKNKFDLIFCRNVMIYFDKTTQQRIVQKFYDCMNNGAYLFIGHSESLNAISHSFKYIKPAIYQKI